MDTSLVKTVLLFSGQGSHHFQMGRELFEGDADFRSHIRQADRVVRERCGESVLDVLYADHASRDTPLSRLLHSHAAIFMVEYALAQTLRNRGITVDKVLGASLGSFAAATVAGWVDMEAALLAVIEQALAVEANVEPGGMIAVLGDPGICLDAALRDICELAATNFPTHSVLAMPGRHIGAVETRLQQLGLAFQRLPVAFPFHSRWIEPARATYTSYLRTLPVRNGELPVICCATGEALARAKPDHFWSVVRDPIRLPRALARLESDGPHRYIDVSPGGTMATFLKHGLPADSASRVDTVMSPFGGELERLQALRPQPARLTRKAESLNMKAVIFPGQGSQFKGMGKDVFPLFPDQLKVASEILGYSVEDLCLNDSQGLLSQTRYTQPALYVVNALHYYRQQQLGEGDGAAFFAGHSLGEYNALLAAGVFSFETGLRLVQKRGELMGNAGGGGMAAVLGTSAGAIRDLLDEHRVDGIDIANLNTPTQTVIAGDHAAIDAAATLFASHNLRFVRLNVSAPFHSRHMQPVQAEFADFLGQFDFDEPRVAVIANATGRPYEGNRIAETLARQIAAPVHWVDSIRYVMGRGDVEFQEVGANILSKMVNEIRSTQVALVDSVQESPVKTAVGGRDDASAITADSLGSTVFKRRYGVRYAYMTGAMYRGVASADLVIRMGKAGFLSFFGAGGLSITRIETSLSRIREELADGQPFGMNLLANHDYPEQEDAVVDLYLRHGVKNVEAAAFMQMTPALVRFRVQGLRRDGQGDIVCDHRIVAKISRPEVAQAFMSPPPAAVVEKLVERGQVTQQQAEWARGIPMSHDICVEADSGGHTDGGIVAVMLPPLMRLRDRMQATHAYAEPISMGLAGGIGSPEAAAAAFLLGADFIATGSINQCTVESGMSADGKALLQQMDIQDTAYAPAGDMFEIGANVQVLKKSVFFPARANKLLSLYRHHESLDDIPERTRRQLETTFFRKTFAEIWQDTQRYFVSAGMEHEIRKAEVNPKHRMALTFRWYFSYCTRIAIEGKGEDRVNYQIQTGPALGSFNQWVKGTPLEPWTARHVDDIAHRIMAAAAEHLTQSFTRLRHG